MAPAPQSNVQLGGINEEEKEEEKEEDEWVMPVRNLPAVARWDNLLYGAHYAAMDALDDYMEGPSPEEGHGVFEPDGDGRVMAYVDTFTSYIFEQIGDDIVLTDDEELLVHEDSRIFWVDHQWQECVDGLPVGFQRDWPDQFDERSFFDIAIEEIGVGQGEPNAATLADVQPRVVHILRRMTTDFPDAYQAMSTLTTEIMQGDNVHQALYARHLHHAIRLLDAEVSSHVMIDDSRSQE